MSQLKFRTFEDDFTLHSYILANRLWREIPIKSLTLALGNIISIGLTEFIFTRKNLEYFVTSFELKVIELEALKTIFSGCKNLESIKIWCGGKFLSEKDALETTVKYSQDICELILYHQSDVRFELLPEDLESFFISWRDRKSRKLLTLTVTKDYSKSSNKN
ncbi:hypothetical protein GLOIN_2v1715049 [Rhizophagus clarus]|uniref:F-box domain-containing protein n=1 Tax=Rhizophagus clarus TaxID=94130 RepID=A0A8H3M463_9GLOM|nr:hypothetical protein GLOIN_2v1715049 [Rhizophagus clarus]